MRSLPGPTHLTGKGFPDEGRTPSRRATLIRWLPDSLRRWARPVQSAVVRSHKPGGCRVTVEAPIHSVVVYSDRARVTRSARVGLSGTQPILLPPFRAARRSEQHPPEAQGPRSCASRQPTSTPANCQKTRRSGCSKGLRRSTMI